MLSLEDHTVVASIWKKYTTRINSGNPSQKECVHDIFGGLKKYVLVKKIKINNALYSFFT